MPLLTLRGREISRLEALSDAIFGFAATLLVVSLEVPRTYPELMENLQGFAAFGLTFGFLIMIWAAHNGFFRRYGLQDPWTIVLNSVLLFLVLFYVYPLKFLAAVFVTNFFGIRAGGLDPAERISLGELSSLMALYSLGFAAVFTCVALLYQRALAKRKELDLDLFEQLEARSLFHHYLIYVGVALLSVALAALKVGLTFGLPGLVYFLLGPFCYWNGVVTGRRHRELERTAGTAPLPEAAG